MLEPMNLTGAYAKVDHACIYGSSHRNLGAERIAMVENHHKFARMERNDAGRGPEDLVVHRKGATTEDRKGRPSA